MPREIHIHVEEPSMEAYLNGLTPRLLETPVRIINHRSKQKLLRDIPKRLCGYARIEQNSRPLTLILVDRDNDDCFLLKAQLENAAALAGLVTKSSVTNAKFDVVNRIVIEELEAWHFGDIRSLCAEFPGVPVNIAARAPYRDPDLIAGGTHEALLRVLQKAGHFKGNFSLPKIDTARRLGQRVDIKSDRSVSFKNFISGLQALALQLQEATPNG